MPSKMRYDKETGALADRELPPSTSASDNKKFLKHPKEDADHPFAYLPGIYLITGPLGSGKSSLIYSLLNEFSEILNPKQLGRIVYYSGSGMDKILDHYDASEMEMFDPKSKESFQTVLHEFMNDEVPHDEKKMNILVLDDAISDADIIPKSVQSQTPLSKVMMSARHIPVAIVMTSQKYNSFPTFARSNASHVFVFKTKTPAERQSILKEVNFSKGEVENALDTLTEPNSFIWMNNLHRKIVKDLTVPLVR